MDGKTFSAQGEVCVSTTHCVCLPATWEGTRCGNGVLDSGEDCDDGDGDSSDGCSSDCEVETCFSCSGDPSICSPTPGVGCDDENSCTTGDVCDGVANCTGAVALGMQCDDANACTSGDECNASGVCTGATVDCDDGLSCTEDSCDTASGCINERPARSCGTAAESLFALRDSGNNEGDALVWKWRGGDATFAELSDPTTTAVYRLCVYAGATSAVIAEANVAPSAQAWDASGQRRYHYRDMGGSQSGIRSILLRAGQGDAAVSVRGKGTNLPDPSLPPLLPVSVELENQSSGSCWGASYDSGDVLANGTRKFRAKRP
jgi:cysteine-rich repeat protein